MKDKQLSMKKGVAFAKGGNGKMQKQQHTGTQTPGVTSQQKGASTGNGPKGGTTKMFGKQTSKLQKPA